MHDAYYILIVVTGFFMLLIIYFEQERKIAIRKIARERGLRFKAKSPLRVVPGYKKFGLFSYALRHPFEGVVRNRMYGVLPGFGLEEKSPGMPMVFDIRFGKADVAHSLTVAYVRNKERMPPFVLCKRKGCYCSISDKVILEGVGGFSDINVKDALDENARAFVSRNPNITVECNGYALLVYYYDRLIDPNSFIQFYMLAKEIHDILHGDVDKEDYTNLIVSKAMQKKSLTFNYLKPRWIIGVMVIIIYALF